MRPLLGPYLTRPKEQPAQDGADDWLVVVSQTCDVVAQTLEAEPLIEVLLCRQIAGRPRKGKRNLKSTRYLDFRPNRDTHPDVVLTAHATVNRYVIPRSLLKDYAPDQDRRLDGIASARVLAWYALRASRPSWPSRFCDCVRGASAMLEEALDPLSDDIAEVRVAIAEKDQELEEGRPYHLTVFFVVDEAIWDGDLEHLTLINQTFDDFVAALNKCMDVEIDQDLSEVVVGSKFTWQDIQQTDLWNFANLSYRD